MVSLAWPQTPWPAVPGHSQPAGLASDWSAVPGHGQPGLAPDWSGVPGHGQPGLAPDWSGVPWAGLQPGLAPDWSVEPGHGQPGSGPRLSQRYPGLVCSRRLAPDWSAVPRLVCSRAWPQTGQWNPVMVSRAWPQTGQRYPAMVSRPGPRRHGQRYPGLVCSRRLGPRLVSGTRPWSAGPGPDAMASGTLGWSAAGAWPRAWPHHPARTAWITLIISQGWDSND